ncbi:MAG TPA: hypothetical protein VD886_11575 [Herpetosiphonaceae bacterium]|nr:hypothetical protein [Herpetosiphonaceae bacterium]
MRDSRPTPAYWQLDLLVISLLIVIGLLIVLDAPVVASFIAGLCFSGIALWVWENSDALAGDLSRHQFADSQAVPSAEPAAEPTSP